MEKFKKLRLVGQRLVRLTKKYPTLVSGGVLLLILLPVSGFCDINSAFGETKEQVESIVSNRSGLFWIFMAVILGSGIWSLFKGSWKGVGIALLIGVVLGNFSDVIDTVLNTKIFKNKTEHEQIGKR